MKKWIILLLCLAVLLGCAACSAGSNETTAAPTTTAPAAGFRVGFGRGCFTPTGPVPLSGFGNDSERMSTRVLDDLFVTVIAVSDADDNTVLMITCDIIRSTPSSSVKQLINAASKASGVPAANIFYSSTHSHSTPSPASGGISDLLKEAIEKAAADAMADRCEAQMYIGTAQTENLNFVRLYTCNDGSYVGDNHGSRGGKTLTGHATEADNQMQLIRFVREGSKDILLMNWQAHPSLTSIDGDIKTDVSADYIGPCRDTIEQELDCHFAFFQGAAGNLNPYSWIASENISEKKDHQLHGQALARCAIDALDSLQLVQPGPVQVTSKKVECTVDRPTSDLMTAAIAFKDAYKTGGIQAGVEASGGLVQSTFEADSITTRASMNATENIQIYAVSFGDVSFVTAPYEMFDINGMFVKENTPFEMTFILYLCNGGRGYIPSDCFFDYGSYEVDTTYYVRGTAEQLADSMLELLKDLRGA